MIPGLLTTTLGPISPEVRRVCVGGVGAGDVEIGDPEGDTTETPLWLAIGVVGATGDEWANPEILFAGFSDCPLTDGSIIQILH